MPQVGQLLLSQQSTCPPLLLKRQPRHHARASISLWLWPLTHRLLEDPVPLAADGRDAELGVAELRALHVLAAAVAAAVLLPPLLGHMQAALGLHSRQVLARLEPQQQQHTHTPQQGHFERAGRQTEGHNQPQLLLSSWPSPLTLQLPHVLSAVLEHSSVTYSSGPHSLQ